MSPAGPVVGADLSLAGSALATRTTAAQLKTKGRKDDRYPQRLARVRAVSAWVTDKLAGLAPGLIVLEAPAPNAVQRISVWDRAHVWWSVVDWADARGIPVAYCPPTNLKKFATGNGHADKPTVLAAARGAFPHLPIRNDNDADAAWLAAMGHAWLGEGLLERTGPQTRSLAGVLWPAAPAGTAPTVPAPRDPAVLAPAA